MYFSTENMHCTYRKLDKTMQLNVYKWTLFETYVNSSLYYIVFVFLSVFLPVWRNE